MTRSDTCGQMETLSVSPLGFCEVNVSIRQSRNWYSSGSAQSGFPQMSAAVSFTCEDPSENVGDVSILSDPQLLFVFFREWVIHSEPFFVRE